MVDIHCHLLFGVDDGPNSIEESIALLQEAAAQGVTDVVMTPHYRRGMFQFSAERTREHKEALMPYAKELGVNLYVGTEIHVNGDILEYLEEGRVLPLAESEYILTEYGYDTEYGYLMKMTQEFLRHGYIPVIAHVERYKCLVDKPKRLEELQEIGAMVQMNAAAILGKEGWGTKAYCKKVLAQGLVDVVASDCHDFKKRKCYLQDCYAYVAAKYGEKRANRLFVKNPGKIIAK